MNNELEKLKRELCWFNLRCYSGIFSWGTEENTDTSVRIADTLAEN
jgi:hypothetical protein